MIELLEAAALDPLDQPDVPAVVTDDSTVGYQGLYQLATEVAAGLTDSQIRRFGIVHQDAATAVALLGGASLAGAEACVYPPLDNPEVARDTAARFEHDVLISDEPLLEGDFEAITPAALRAERWRAPEQPPNQRPLLVLTTGTTGTPRGVRHDWSRVVRSVARVRPGRRERWLLAYGMHQFAGLQILVHVLAARATLVAPTPRRPREGLAAMRAHHVDHASATPTFWRFLLAEMRSDRGPVPALSQITLGGEAIPGSLLEQLSATFPSARISQVYAGNEFGSTGSVRDGRSGLPVSILGRHEDADVGFKLVDGELWIRSRIGMLGYYGDPPLDGDGWRPTGDLVEVVGDRIMFRGRASEIINVGGVKVHPLPIEERIGAVSGVALARVYGRPNPLTGMIVAADIVAEAGTDTGVVNDAIRQACMDLSPAERPRSVRFVDAIPLAGEQKIKRS